MEGAQGKPDVKLTLPALWKALGACLADGGVEAYAVGGGVRDRLLGRPVYDLDIASPVPAEALAELARRDKRLAVRMRDAGLAAATVIYRGPEGRLEAEYTAFRNESYRHDGSHRPLEVRQGVTLQEDALRRDFTVNALYARLTDGRIADPLGGGAHLEKRILVTTRNSDEVFAEDGLRVLRMVRLACQLDFSVEPATWQGACRQCRGIGRLQPARIGQELARILVSDQEGAAAKGLLMLQELGAWPWILPRMRPPPDWQAHLAAVERTPRRLETRLAALLAPVGAAGARAACVGLEYGRERAGAVFSLIDALEQAARDGSTPAERRRILASLGEVAGDWLALWQVLTAPGPEQTLQWRLALEDVRRRHLPKNVNELMLSGRRIGEILGTRDGHGIGACKRALYDYVMEHPEENDPGSLQSVVTAWKDGFPQESRTKTKEDMMASFVIKGARVFTPQRELKNLDVLVKDGKIAQVGENLAAEKVVDGSGKVLSPGFIDLHQHGMLGVDCVEDSDHPIEVMSEALPRYGVTGFLPTVMTAPLEGMGAIAKRMARGIRQTGARAIGLYMEGPHLNCAYKGAQEEEYMVDPSMENWEIINGGHPETIKVFAMDPTRDGALDVARNLKGSLVLSCAHTPCDWQQAQDAFAAGFSHVTHLFNAMKPLHHRNPGLVGAALVNDAITCELIADLIHLHPDVLRLAVEMKGPDHICLITDAMMAAGMEDGEYTLGGQKVFVKNGEARLADGTLAGSTLTLNKAVYNMVKKVGFPLTTILPMVTSTPAREAGCADRMGLIAPGYEADLVLLNDDLDICATWVGGELKYQK